MVLESTMICIDNSDYMRNGDFIPNRLQAQQDAINMVCHSKTRSNPENSVGLITLANRVEVLTTLTTDMGRILGKLHQIRPTGNINFLTGMRIAQLALRHRQGRNQKMRIVVFVGSPIDHDEKEAIKVAKRLKKEKVNVDVVSFGEDAANASILVAFIDAINGKDGTGSHLVSIPPGPHLTDALVASPVIQGEDGVGVAGLSAGSFEFGVDPNEDPELALALRVSMEEQRNRQQEEARRAQVSEANAAGAAADDVMLEHALAMSMDTDGTSGANVVAPAAPSVAAPDFSTMTEDEQIAFALRMSMQEAAVAMDTATADEPKPATGAEADSASAGPSVSTPVSSPASTSAGTSVGAVDSTTLEKMDVDDYDPKFYDNILTELSGVAGDKGSTSDAKKDNAGAKKEKKEDAKEPGKKKEEEKMEEDKSE